MSVQNLIKVVDAANTAWFDAVYQALTPLSNRVHIQVFAGLNNVLDMDIRLPADRVEWNGLGVGTIILNITPMAVRDLHIADMGGYHALVFYTRFSGVEHMLSIPMRCIRSVIGYGDETFMVETTATPAFRTNPAEDTEATPEPEPEKPKRERPSFLKVVK